MIKRKFFLKNQCILLIISLIFYIIISLTCTVKVNNLKAEIQDVEIKINTLKNENLSLSLDIKKLENKNRVYTIALDSGLTQKQKIIEMK